MLECWILTLLEGSWPRRVPLAQRIPVAERGLAAKPSGRRRNLPWLMLGSLERDLASQSRQKCEPARTRTDQGTELSFGSRPVPESAKTKPSSSQGGAHLSFRNKI